MRACPHFSALTWRILAFNALALLILTGGRDRRCNPPAAAWWKSGFPASSSRPPSSPARLAEYATDPKTHTLDVDAAEPLLRQLIAPTRLRARLYLPNGHLVVDTRLLLPRNIGADGRAAAA